MLSAGLLLVQQDSEPGLGRFQVWLQIGLLGKASAPLTVFTPKGGFACVCINMHREVSPIKFNGVYLCANMDRIGLQTHRYD